MKIMGKHWLWAGLGFVLAVGAVGCQEDGGSPASVTTPQGAGDALLSGSGPRMPLLHRLDQKLGLTSTQHDAVKAILQREHQAMVQSGVLGQGRDAVRQAMLARREKVADEIAGLLTPEQKSTFAELRARLHDRLAGGFGHGEILTKELGLSPEQQAQVKTMLDARHGVTPNFRGQPGDGGVSRAELRQRARAGREAFRTQLEAILTPEQLAHFRQLVAEWKKDIRD